MATAAKKIDKKAFQKRVAAAVADRNLALALSRSLPEFSRRRANAFVDQDFPGKRRRVRDLKQDALTRLPELIDQFTREAEAVGARVHLAATPDAAVARATALPGFAPVVVAGSLYLVGAVRGALTGEAADA